MPSEDRVHRVHKPVEISYIDVPTDEEVLKGLHQKEHRIPNAKNLHILDRVRELEDRITGLQQANYELKIMALVRQIKVLKQKNKDLESRLQDVERWIESERTWRMEHNE